jgi:GDP-L-fucose synthase
MTKLDFYKDKKVAVLGGGGFLGSRIVARLKDAGAEVSVPRTSKPIGGERVPRTEDSLDPHTKRELVPSARDIRGSRSGEGVDFRNEKTCDDYFAKTKPEIVFNCAAFQGGIGFHSGKQANLFLDNVKMGLFLMEAAQKNGVKKFVNIVAGCSYPGYLEKDELNEEDYWNGEVHDSIFSYGMARKTSVVYGKALYKQYGFNSIHLIYANMYGPGEHFNPEQSKALAGLLKKFYEAKKNNLPSVEVWGTGRPVRDWMYVDDGAEGALVAGAVYDDIEPLNIASGVGISVADLARMIQKITGYKGKIVFNTAKPDGALKKTFGVKKMKEKLNWLPQTPLEKGIKETLDWLDKNYDWAVKT